MKYGFSRVINALFEMPTADARRILPPHLVPLEQNHQRSILSLIAFDFVESVIGPYRELVMSIAVPPLAEAGRELPAASFHPYLVATTTKASRDHAIETWHLPHWMEDVEIDFAEGPGTLQVEMSVGGSPAVSFGVAEGAWEPGSRLYQGCFVDEAGAFLSAIRMEGVHSEHEHETGFLRLADCEFNRALAVEEVEDRPFREAWMKEGLQTFAPLRPDPRVADPKGRS